MANSSAPAQPAYTDAVVRGFALVAVLYGIVGMLVGVIVASQLAWPELINGIPWLTYGRLRPLHTNAVIFAFGGSVLFATSYHVVQRTCQTALFLPKLAWFTFIGWNLIVLSAVVTLPLGMTSGKEYAELEWPIDILIAVVWVAYAVLFFGTIAKRRVNHIYVANWFYGSFILAVALLHIVNSLAIPAGLTKSYSVYSGAVDAMVIMEEFGKGLVIEPFLPTVVCAGGFLKHAGTAAQATWCARCAACGTWPWCAPIWTRAARSNRCWKSTASSSRKRPRLAARCAAGARRRSRAPSTGSARPSAT